jgi:ABC-type sugar transport system ATPase subunit
MSFDEVYQHISKEYYQLQQVQTQLNLNKETEQKLIQDLAKCESHIQLLDDGLSIFKILQEKLTQNHINHITQLINHALSTVFDDEFTQYQIRIEVNQQRNNNTAQFYLLTTQQQETTETLLQNNGFGIQSLIGFVLQIYFILQHNQAHILFLDESLTAISTDKLPRLKQFIQQVSQQYDFYFILIAHMESLFDLADYTYHVDQGKVTLLKGGAPHNAQA